MDGPDNELPGLSGNLSNKLRGQQVASLLLALNIGIAEIVVIAVVGMIVIPMLFLPALGLYYLGHPYQALACGAVSLTGVGFIVGIIWIAVVAIYDAGSTARKNGPGEVPE